MSIDDVIRQMQEDEQSDRIEQQTKATPIEYGRLRGIVPQKIHYHIRKGRIELEQCVCGRKVIDIKAADAFFRLNQTTEDDDEDETNSRVGIEADTDGIDDEE